MKLHLTLILILAASVSVFAQSEKDWEGFYEFSEGTPRKGPQMSFSHYVDIEILPENRLNVTFGGTGHYFSRELNCLAKISGNTIMIYYDGSSGKKNYYSYNADRLDYLKDGDLLLTLERRRVKRKFVILTFWGKFEPILTRPPTGRVYFRKSRS
jgi:hypothetical protein